MIAKLISNPLLSMMTITNKKYMSCYAHYKLASSQNTKACYQPVHYEHDRQSDTYNCGVICPLIMEKVILKESACKYTPNDLLEYRDKLFNLIFKYRKC